MPDSLVPIRHSAELVSAWLFDLDHDQLGEPGGEYMAASLRVLEDLGPMEDGSPAFAALLPGVTWLAATALQRLGSACGTTAATELRDIVLFMERLGPRLDPPASGD